MAAHERMTNFRRDSCFSGVNLSAQRRKEDNIMTKNFLGLFKNANHTQKDTEKHEELHKLTDFIIKTAFLAQNYEQN